MSDNDRFFNFGPGSHQSASQGSVGTNILNSAEGQTNRKDVTSLAGGKSGDAYCMHSITAAAKDAGYTELYKELKGTAGNVAAFKNLAQKHGSYHAGNGIPPAGTAAIMSLSGGRPDHVGLSYGDGTYREANPGFRNVNRGSKGIIGHVNLESLNNSISRSRKRSELDVGIDNTTISYTPDHNTRSDLGTLELPQFKAADNIRSITVNERV